MRFLWAAGGILADSILEPEEYRQPIAPSLLQVLRNRFTVDSPGNGLPKDIGDTGLADLWLHKLCEMCHTDPQDVLDSEVLGFMIGFYRGDAYADARPRTTELPRPFDETYTWLRILQHLEASCKTAVEEQAKEGEQSAQEGEHQSTVLDVGEGNGDNTDRSKNLYWAM